MYSNIYMMGLYNVYNKLINLLHLLFASLSNLVCIKTPTSAKSVWLHGLILCANVSNSWYIICADCMVVLVHSIASNNAHTLACFVKRRKPSFTS
jgi:hypothetical protein